MNQEAHQDQDCEHIRWAARALDDSPAAAVLWRIDSEPWLVERVSAGVERLLGHTREDLESGRVSLPKLVHPDDLQGLTSALGELLAAGSGERSCEYRVFTKSGGIVWLQTSNHVVRNPAGRPTHIESLLYDITTHKEALELLQIQRDLFVNVCSGCDFAATLRLCLDAALRASGMECGGIYLLNKAGGLRLALSVGVSEAFAESAQYYPRDDAHTRIVMRGEPTYGVYPEVDVFLDPTRKREALLALAVIPIWSANQLIGCVNVASRHSVDIALPNRAALETVASVVGQLVGRAEADEALSTQSAIVQTMAEGAFLVRVSDRTIVYANPRLEQIFGYGSGEMAGLPVAQLVQPQPDRNAEQVLDDFVTQFQETGQEGCESLNIRKDGTSFWASAQTASLEHPQFGKVQVVALHDITERKDAEEAIARKNAALHELVEQIAVEKMRIQNSIVANMEELITPLLTRLRTKGTPRHLVDLLDNHLRDITSPYSEEIIRSTAFQLTPRQAEICAMVKAGFTSKEIAKALGLSVQTVQRHRRDIRRRLNLTGTRQNLSAFLMER